MNGEVAIFTSDTLYFSLRESVSMGFTHQFFYGFRYFVSPCDLLDLIREKFRAAALSLAPMSQLPIKVKVRSAYILEVWLSGYYDVDFSNDPDFLDELEAFLNDEVSDPDFLH